MGDGFYSFKLIIHQIQLDAASIFIESGMQEIATPVFLLKFLNFPMIMIKG